MRIVVAIAVAIGALWLGAGSQAQAAEKYVTLTPTSGVVGTVVTAELFNAPPNDDITVIFKIPGDPVLATGKTDSKGYAKFTFTIPYVPGGGTWPIFLTDFKCSCQIATEFTVINSRPTPTPTATATVPKSPTPATSTPTRTATPTGTAAVATPTATSTPKVPVLGTGNVGGGPGPNVGVLALGFMATLTVLAWFFATRRAPGGPGGPALAVAAPDDGGPDYSTELDLESLEAMRPFRREVTTSPRRRGSTAWAVGAGISALAGILLLRKK